MLFDLSTNKRIFLLLAKYFFVKFSQKSQQDFLKKILTAFAFKNIALYLWKILLTVREKKSLRNVAVITFRQWIILRAVRQLWKILIRICLLNTISPRLLMSELFPKTIVLQKNEWFLCDFTAKCMIARLMLRYCFGELILADWSRELMYSPRGRLEQCFCNYESACF